MSKDRKKHIASTVHRKGCQVSELLLCCQKLLRLMAMDLLSVRLVGRWEPG